MPADEEVAIMSWYTSSSGQIELQITRAQAAACSHPGPCDADVLELSRAPAIARQLRKIPADVLAAELREVGAWDSVELADHAQNLQRLLWISCGDIDEAVFNKRK